MEKNRESNYRYSHGKKANNAVLFSCCSNFVVEVNRFLALEKTSCTFCAHQGARGVSPFILSPQLFCNQQAKDQKIIEGWNEDWLQWDKKLNRRSS